MITKFENYIKENEGGGVAYSTLSNTNGMGNVVTPTVGSSPGQVWGKGSGDVGSGDLPAYDMGNKFDFIKPKKRKKKKKRDHSELGEDYSHMYVTKFDEWLYPKFSVKL